jgi:hypothetical protein
MEFLKAAKRRSLWSEVAYVGLNVLLAIIILVVVLGIESPLPAFALVLLSKWRVLAVRPRYWFAHILSNAVDIIVSLSLVVLLSAANGALLAQIVITFLYILWLLVLKPRSKRSLVVSQAAVGIVVGVTAISIVSYDWYVSFVVLAFWVIGFSTARHVLVAYNHESHVTFLSLVWGFVIAEIGWLSYHWLIAYDLAGVGLIKLPQVAIIIFLLSFMAERTFADSYEHGKIRLNNIILPLLLSMSVIVIILVFFNAATKSLN